MDKYLAENCSTKYESYLHDPNFKSDNTLDCINCADAAVTSCFLNTFHEVDKANMASAAVISGIVPATLSLAGSSTAETGLLSLRRPLMVFLLGAGAPTVSPLRTFNYGNPEDLVQMHTRTRSHTRIGRKWSFVILLLEYALALASVANLCVCSYQLCVRTVCSFAQDTAYLPAMWAFLAAAIHILGTVAVALRVDLKVLCQNSGQYKERSIGTRIRGEFRLSKDQAPANLISRHEGFYFSLVSWCCSSGTVVHIIFGTLVFSSVLFITTLDAVTVAFQFLGSTIVCRAILMYELSGIRQVVRVDELEKDKCDSHRERNHRRGTGAQKGCAPATNVIPLVKPGTTT